MGLINFFVRVKSAALFTRTPAHQSSEALKLQAMQKLEASVTHADFVEVSDYLSRIIVRFEEDDRIEKRQAEFVRNQARPVHVVVDQPKQHQNQNQNNGNGNNGNQQPNKKYGQR